MAPTAADVRDVMVDGESGIHTLHPDVQYAPSLRRLTWPNGTIATTYSADEPDRLRGPQHHWAWCDELCAWRYPDQAWAMLMMGLRLGVRPRVLVTTTPRPIPTLRQLISDGLPRVHVTRGTTYDNLANLAPTYRNTILAQYEGTRLGRQELYAELLEDAAGALWRRADIELHRVTQAVPMRRKVVAVDPAVSSEVTSDETGIIVAGLGTDGHAYVLDDLSGRFTPADWARKANDARARWGASHIVAEANQGGDMVLSTLRTANSACPAKLVHAAKGKRSRAEPIAALYEQGRVHHVGSLPLLEDQLCSWDAAANAKSPDRLDALVWALTELGIQSRVGGGFRELQRISGEMPQWRV